MMRLLQLSEARPQVFSKPRRWPLGESVVKLLGQVLMEDQSAHKRAAEVRGLRGGRRV
jgi:hypothetical protein